MSSESPVQASLFGRSAPSFDSSFANVQRIQLDELCFVDFAPGWVEGDEQLFDQVLAARQWGQRTRWMYDRPVLEPRLTSSWSLASGQSLEPAIVDRMRLALSARYRVILDSVGFNHYRDGQDGVAWHRDKIRADIAEPVVALVSLGEPRRLLFRPRGGGRSRAFSLGRGDLLVTGGLAQRNWEHAVLKVARALPRVSLAFRHGLDPRAYGRPAIPPR